SAREPLSTRSSSTARVCCSKASRVRRQRAGWFQWTITTPTRGAGGVAGSGTRATTGAPQVGHSLVPGGNAVAAHDLGEDGKLLDAGERTVHGNVGKVRTVAEDERLVAEPGCKLLGVLAHPLMRVGAI